MAPYRHPTALRPEPSSRNNYAAGVGGTNDLDDDAMSDDYDPLFIAPLNHYGAIPPRWQPFLPAFVVICAPILVMSAIALEALARSMGIH